MDISPQTIRSTGFKTVKKGYDPEEVEDFRNQVATTVEAAQNQATAMEARARAAVAKLQEVTQQAAVSGREAAAPVAPSGDTEVISRTLLLAQRTADLTVAEAKAEAEGITAHAREEASRVIDSARAMAVKTVDDSRAEARRAVEDERVRAENEVQSLLARRDFLLGDVDHLEQYLQAQRERMRDAAVQLQELVDRVPGGLGEMRRPLLSASAEPLDDAEPGAAASTAPDGAEAPAPPAEEAVPTDDAASTDDAARSADETPPSLAEGDPSLAHDAEVGELALSGDRDARDDVWRLLDEEVASTQAAQASLKLGDVTTEAPVQRQPPQ